jgi:hypothetical protein
LFSDDGRLVVAAQAFAPPMKRDRYDNVDGPLLQLHNLALDEQIRKRRREASAIPFLYSPTRLSKFILIRSEPENALKCKSITTT